MWKRRSVVIQMYAGNGRRAIVCKRARFAGENLQGNQNTHNKRTFFLFQAASTDGNTLNYELTGLVEGVDYFIRVRAENMAGVSTGFCELEEPTCAKEPVSEYLFTSYGISSMVLVHK